MNISDFKPLLREEQLSVFDRAFDERGIQYHFQRKNDNRGTPAFSVKQNKHVKWKVGNNPFKAYINHQQIHKQLFEAVKSGKLKAYHSLLMKDQLSDTDVKTR